MRSNCGLYALAMWIEFGGYVMFRWSQDWPGLHFLWLSERGQYPMHWTCDPPPKQYLLFHGEVQQSNETKGGGIDRRLIAGCVGVVTLFVGFFTYFYLLFLRRFFSSRFYRYIEVVQ